MADSLRIWLIIFNEAAKAADVVKPKARLCEGINILDESSILL
jgi:hypothetical protein